jgi:hypothetical protein
MSCIKVQDWHNQLLLQQFSDSQNNVASKMNGRRRRRKGVNDSNTTSAARTPVALLHRPFKCTEHQPSGHSTCRLASTAIILVVSLAWIFVSFHVIPEHDEGASLEKIKESTLPESGRATAKLDTSFTKKDKVVTLPRPNARKSKQQRSSSLNQSAVPKPTVLLFITSHGSENHVQHLLQCWPATIRHLALVRNANVLLYLTNSTAMETNINVELLQRIGFRHDIRVVSSSWYDDNKAINGNDEALSMQQLRIKFQEQRQRWQPRLVVEPGSDANHTMKIFPNGTIVTSQNGKLSSRYNEDEDHDKQMGAKIAMVEPFFMNWFRLPNSTDQYYDWVIRLNPDVLIRNDTWFRDKMSNASVHAMGVDFSIYDNVTNKIITPALHTDFFAFRPQRLSLELLVEHFSQPTAETHLGAACRAMWPHIAWIPGVIRYKRKARILGRYSPVIHQHGPRILRACPNYFDIHHKRWY